MYGVAGQKRISDDFVKGYRVDPPELDVQQRIAEYLDAETARIDELLAELRHMKTLGKEQSFASQAVAALGGEERRARLEGAEPWMGSLPSHWRVARLKFEARLESGHTPSRSRPELWKDCSIPWISLNDVTAMASSEFVHDTVNRISEAGLAASSARVLPAGTVVLSRDATIGRTAILAEPMATSQHFADWICGPDLEPRYLWLLFRTAMQSHFSSLTDGATLRTIGMPDLRQLRVPLAPKDEQRAIVEEAALVRARETALRSELDAQISLLREHRQALITHAVTRGIDGLPGVV
jgi:type I restriction enzyme S subunit